MNKLELNGRVLFNGTLSIPLRSQITEWCNSHLDAPVKMTLEVKRKIRSNPQNAYYWGVTIPLVKQGFKDIGHPLSENETHEFLKKEFNLKEVELENGHSLTLPQSTTELTTVDFMEYLEKIAHFAANMLSAHIPAPNEQTAFDY